MPLQCYYPCAALHYKTLAFKSTLLSDNGFIDWQTCKVYRRGQIISSANMKRKTSKVRTELTK